MPVICTTPFGSFWFPDPRTHEQVPSWAIEVQAPGASAYVAAGALVPDGASGADNLWTGSVAGSLLTQVGCTPALISSE
jgi:hypothetical protein